MSDRVLYSISINDNIYFHSIVDVLNECFGKGYKACYKSFMPVDNTHQAWFPKMAVIKNGERKASPRSQGWLSTIGNNMIIVSAIGTAVVRKEISALKDIINKAE